MKLVQPAPEHISSYVMALKRGWSPWPARPEAASEELERIRTDVDGFLAACEDRDAREPPVTLLDGSAVPRLPSLRRWLWDGEFCGAVSLRWQPGTAALRWYCLGHVGYSVVPWKQGRGYATSALGQLLSLAEEVSLPYVEITTDADNISSRRVIEANGGQLVEEFTKPTALGGGAGLRFRIALQSER